MKPRSIHYAAPASVQTLCYRLRDELTLQQVTDAEHRVTCRVCLAHPKLVKKCIADPALVPSAAPKRSSKVAALAVHGRRVGLFGR